MEALKNILSRFSKPTLIALVILFGGLWTKKMIRENEAKQNLILTNQQTLGTNQVTIQKTMEDGFGANVKQHEDIMLNVSEMGQKQKVVVKTLPVMDQNTIKQIEQIYEQMRKDQSPKDSKAMDDGYIEPKRLETFH